MFYTKIIVLLSSKAICIFYKKIKLIKTILAKIPLYKYRLTQKRVRYNFIFTTRITENEMFWKKPFFWYFFKFIKANRNFVLSNFMLAFKISKLKCCNFNKIIKLVYSIKPRIVKRDFNAYFLMKISSISIYMPLYLKL